ncbi:MAG: hypothetical protein ACP6IU_11680 [Candidatus Asgardarchaeia archaeon]
MSWYRDEIIWGLNQLIVRAKNAMEKWLLSHDGPPEVLITFFNVTENDVETAGVEVLPIFDAIEEVKKMALVLDKLEGKEYQLKASKIFNVNFMNLLIAVQTMEGTIPE